MSNLTDPRLLANSIQNSIQKKILKIKFGNSIVPFGISPQNTNEQLFQQVRAVLQRKFPDLDSTKIIALKTVDDNDVLDSYLLMKEQLVDNIDESQVLEPVMRPDNLFERDSIHINDLDFIKCIGKGGSSEVYLVRHKNTGKLYALKQIIKKTIEDKRRFEQILLEQELLKDLKHEFLVQLRATFESDRHLNFLIDFYPGGELFFHLQKTRFTEEDAKFFFCEIILVLEYLHKRKILYRDLKPENILLGIDGHIKLTDFGLCKTGLEDDELTTSFCGSPEYMAPEVVVRDGHSYGVDFYTLGALLHELVCGLPPFYSRDPEEMMVNILQDELELPDDISDELYDLLMRLLDKNMHNRLVDFNIIKGHPWLDGINWESVLRKELQSPIMINLFETNIHDEFLQIQMNPSEFVESEDFQRYIPYFNYTVPESTQELLNQIKGPIEYQQQQQIPAAKQEQEQQKQQQQDSSSKKKQSQPESTQIKTSEPNSKQQLNSLNQSQQNQESQPSQSGQKEVQQQAQLSHREIGNYQPQQQQEKSMTQQSMNGQSAEKKSQKSQQQQQQQSHPNTGGEEVQFIDPSYRQFLVNNSKQNGNKSMQNQQQQQQQQQKQVNNNGYQQQLQGSNLYQAKAQQQQQQQQQQQYQQQQQFLAQQQQQGYQPSFQGFQQQQMQQKQQQELRQQQELLKKQQEIISQKQSQVSQKINQHKSQSSFLQKQILEERVNQTRLQQQQIQEKQNSRKSSSSLTQPKTKPKISSQNKLTGATSKSLIKGTPGKKGGVSQSVDKKIQQFNQKSHGINAVGKGLNSQLSKGFMSTKNINAQKSFLNSNNLSNKLKKQNPDTENSQEAYYPTSGTSNNKVSNGKRPQTAQEQSKNPKKRQPSSVQKQVGNTRPSSGKNVKKNTQTYKNLPNQSSLLQSQVHQQNSYLTGHHHHKDPFIPRQQSQIISSKQIQKAFTHDKSGNLSIGNYKPSGNTSDLRMSNFISPHKYNPPKTMKSSITKEKENYNQKSARSNSKKGKITTSFNNHSKLGSTSQQGGYTNSTQLYQQSHQPQQYNSKLNSKQMQQQMQMIQKKSVLGEKKMYQPNHHPNPYNNSMSKNNNNSSKINNSHNEVVGATGKKGFSHSSINPMSSKNNNGKISTQFSASGIQKQGSSSNVKKMKMASQKKMSMNVDTQTHKKIHNQVVQEKRLSLAISGTQSTLNKNSKLNLMDYNNGTTKGYVHSHKF